MKQKDIAELFGINSATISQYSSTKRAHQIHFPSKIIEEIKMSAGRITSRLSYLKEIQHLLYLIREEKILCQIHHDFSVLPDHCDPHLVGCLKKMEATPCLK
jgi:predicted transcriptional regulator